ncbi:hypothetical protein TYRP_002358 [Tyrophagus putrescentiae]|nr:hypothetical protein TYRP_002358 [Tyrophagus putrescentiae]
MVQDDQQHVLPGANKCSCSCCTWPVFAAVLTGRTRRQLNPPQRAAVIIIIVISRSGDRGDSRTNSASPIDSATAAATAASEQEQQ